MPQKGCPWPQTHAGCSQRRRDHREVCGPPETSSLFSSILEMRGTALQKAPGTLPTSLQLRGQLRELLHGPGKADSSHLPGLPPKQMSKQSGASLYSAQQQPSHDTPHSPPPPPEPAGCPGFNPTGSIIPIISSIFNLLPSIFNPLIWGQYTNPFILRAKQSTASSHPISISLIPGNRDEF